jgi:hypothetical protein
VSRKKNDAERVDAEASPLPFEPAKASLEPSPAAAYVPPAARAQQYEAITPITTGLANGERVTLAPGQQFGPGYLAKSTLDYHLERGTIIAIEGR